MARLKPVEFEDRLTLVEHLDELRSRIVASLLVFGVIFAVCVWQSGALLDVANDPLPRDIPGFDPEQLVVLGPAESFTTTLTVSAYMALVLSLPFVLYQAYAFVLPALSAAERSAVLPFLIMAPFLFIAGLVFAFYVVLPAALDFLLDFNDEQFATQLRAREYYSFFALSEAAVGLLFQIPIGLLALIRLGITTPEQLARNRRYAILIIAVLAMLLPGTDPVTMLISMVPLLLLFEGSLILARLMDRGGSGDRTAPVPTEPVEHEPPATPDEREEAEPGPSERPDATRPAPEADDDEPRDPNL